MRLNVLERAFSRGIEGGLAVNVLTAKARPSPIGPPYQELERTGEDLAVSGVHRGRPGEDPSSPGTPPTNLSGTPVLTPRKTTGTPTSTTDPDPLAGYLDSRPLPTYNALSRHKKPQDPAPVFTDDLDTLLKKIDEKKRVVGMAELSKHLQPKHPFFADKEGKLLSLHSYKHDEGSKNYLCYPRVKTQHRLNPYRQKQLARRHCSRVSNRFADLAEAYQLESVKWAIIEMGFPPEITDYLSKHERGANLAWACFKRFWERYVLKLDDTSSGQGYRANLHNWSSENPLEPYYHFHVHIPNCRITEAGGELDEDGAPAYRLETKPWHRQRAGMLVPYSDDDRERLNLGWRKTLLDFAFRHGISLPKLEDGGKADVHLRFDDPATPLGRAKWLHNLAYFGRHPIIDYAEYAIKHPDCDPPLERLQHYDNRTRVGGWLRDSNKLLGAKDTGREKQKRSPFTGKPMVYVGDISVDGIIYLSDGDLGYIDFVKGKPVFGDLAPAEVEWLKQAQHYPNERPPPDDYT
ncbi:unnamed protein product [marine sediment metagenome]|uniref:Uncharacterized protein n=1 Tax=marine sediment metagenome TaxID=412755 RepID=X1S1A5_9ZZZZ